jgi:hypothetical protein
MRDEEMPQEIEGFIERSTSYLTAHTIFAAIGKCTWQCQHSL